MTNLIKNPHSYLAMLIIGGFLLRLSVMVVFETYNFPDQKSMGAEMGWIAHSVVEGRGYKINNQFTAWMAPLYPYLTAPTFRLFGSYSTCSGIALIFFQSLISSVTALPIFLTASHLFDKKVGYLAAILWLIHPGSIIFSVKYTWSSSLTALGLVLIILLFFRMAVHLSSISIPILCGVLIGLTALSDPVILIALPVGILWILWYRRDNYKRAFFSASIIASTCIVVLLPWSIRNYIVFGDVVPVKDTFGMNFWQGNCDHGLNQPTAGLSADHRLISLYSEEDIIFLNSLTEPVRHNILFDRAIRFVTNNPDIFAKYTLHRMYLFWRHTPLPQGTILDRLLFGLIPVFAFGIVISIKNWRKTILPITLFALYPIPYYITISDTYRYRFPLESLMSIFLAFSILYIFSMRDRISANQIYKNF
jgi:hypothetical protein